ncbi:MAG: prepilin-type N-terminal cleavage/methylation domain-containing protein [Deltaproteobacteria bacterium]|nr:prepilin-type N-terminal cleavage/methylation domain-containing protein [Deltaproteobacteria bacterium]
MSGTGNIERRKTQGGFTLVELLIVVVIVGILAAIVIPQFGSSTADAKTSTLQANLSEIRNAVEMYYHQHGAQYPGAVKETDGTTATGTAAEAVAAFKAQLTQYTDKNGKVSVSKDSTYCYGPYLKASDLPKNPFNDLATIVADVTTTDVTAATVDNSTGWKFYVKTGKFLANSTGHAAL